MLFCHIRIIFFAPHPPKIIK